jgi:tail tube protein
MQLPNGLQMAIAATFGIEFTVSAITNATEAVATLSASHGVAVNDIIVLNSGWNGLDKKVARAKTVATNDVTLESFNSTNTTWYPAGSGTGTGKEVSTWTGISGILEPNMEGGDLSFYQYLFVDDPTFTQKQQPTFRSAMALKFKIADDITKPHYAAILAASQARTEYPMRIVLPNGGKIYMNGIWSMNEVPTMTANEGMTLDVAFALQASPTRFAS